MKLVPIIGLLLLSGIAAAQDKNSITGSVNDSTSGAPIAGASVYIANTTHGTTTTKNGHFELQHLKDGNYTLVISYVGFQTKTYDFSSDKLPLQLNVQLATKPTEMESVTVQPFDPNGWAKWGQFFLDNFIGASVVAREVKITNYESIRFRFSPKKNLLTAFCNEPLIIENPALGYRIKYDLEEFRYDSVEHSLFFQGHFFFEDLAASPARISKRLIENRKRAYLGSMMHFIRALYNNNLQAEGFEVNHAVRQSNDFYQIDKSALTAKDLVTVADNGSRYLYFRDYLSITYKNARADNRYINPESGKGGGWGQHSYISLSSGKPVKIEYNGSYFPPLNIFEKEYWAWNEKLGHLLPLDYDMTKGSNEK